MHIVHLLRDFLQVSCLCLCLMSMSISNVYVYVCLRLMIMPAHYRCFNGRGRERAVPAALLEVLLGLQVAHQPGDLACNRCRDCCQLSSKVHVSNFPPDPGALSSCMRTFPEQKNKQQHLHPSDKVRQFSKFQFAIFEGLESHVRIQNYVSNRSKPAFLLRKCMHARIQSPRVWKKFKN